MIPEFQKIKNQIPSKDYLVNISDTVDNTYKLNVLTTKNLCDVDNMKILGGYNDSGYVSSPNYVTLQFIKVKPNTTYTVKTNLDLTKYTALRIVDFNSNQTFIRRSSDIPYTTSNYTFTTSNDAYYIALTFYTNGIASLTDITQAQVQEGNTATEYTPFVSNQINVDNEKYSDTINVGTSVHTNYKVNFITSANVFNMTDTSHFTFRKKGGTPYYQSFILDSYTTNSVRVHPYGGNWTQAYIDMIGLKPNTKYSLSYTISENQTSFSPNMGLDNSGVTDSTGALTLTLGLGNGTSSSSSSTHVTFSDIQVNEGASTLPYLPYNYYGINVDGKESFFSNNYSTDEIRVGTWIDAKPLYRKMVIKTFSETIGPSSFPGISYLVVEHGISNIKTCVKCTGVIFSTTTGYSYKLPVIGYDPNINRPQFTSVHYFSSTELGLRVCNDTWSTSYTFYFECLYTKITD